MTAIARAVRHVTATLAIFAATASAQQPPALTGPVNDFAGVIDAGNRAAISRLSEALQQATGDVLVVATVKTFKPEADIRSFAVKMFDNAARGLGERTRDNGVLVLLAVDDRQVWIEVGYGLEPHITDGFAGETSRETMVPHFRNGDYGGGLLAGSERLASRLAERQGKSLGEAAPRRRASDGDDVGLPIPWPVIVFILLVIISNVSRGRRRRGRRGWGNHWSGWSSGVGPFGGGFGGGFGAGGGGFGGFGGGFGGFGGGRSGGGGGGASW